MRLALLLLDNNLWHDDLPLVMRGALALQMRGAWTETITNAWGTLAVKKFASRFRIDAGRGHHERVDSGGDT